MERRSLASDLAKINRLFYPSSSAYIECFLTVFWIKHNQLKQYDACFVIATDLVFPSEDIGIHIKIKTQCSTR